MMEDIIITISKETRMVDLSKTTIGNERENLQQRLVFKFSDEFCSGTARIEYALEGSKYYAMLEKSDEAYVIPVRSVLTKEGRINMQLVITEGSNEGEIPIFKSNVFYVYCNKSINAEIEEPSGYNEWIDVANTKLNEIDEKLIENETYINGQIENSIGKEIQLDFNAILEDNKIIATLDESIKDYELKNGTGYLFHVYLPLVTLSGDLDDKYEIYLQDKDGNNININCIHQKDINLTSTVGDMCQIQDYDIGIGYSWEFYGHFRKINDNGSTINVVYTDTIVRESVSAMTGQKLHYDVVNSKLKVGTVVICTSDYENNGYKYYRGHSYLIQNHSSDEELLLDTLDITIGA